MRYPFSPEVLDALPEELAELFRSLEETLLDEICSRLKLAGELNEVTVQDIRALRSHGIGLKEIERAIQRTANISEQRLNRLLEDVVERKSLISISSTRIDAFFPPLIRAKSRSSVRVGMTIRRT